MPMTVKSITRYHTNPAMTGARDIYADGAEIAANQRVLHASGQVGIRPDGSTSPDFAEQCDQALMNLLAVLNAAAMGPENIVKLTCYVVGQRPLADLYEARRRRLPKVAPASTTIIVQGLAAPEWLVEIEAIAAA
ncbi:MAG TPA: RidA family protein [Dongiaceae bacterium]|nr:RidA family protein [Dongiaceae bacterium]